VTCLALDYSYTIEQPVCGNITRELACFLRQGLARSGHQRDAIDSIRSGVGVSMARWHVSEAPQVSTVEDGAIEGAITTN
jgi:hypothetical protein